MHGTFVLDLHDLDVAGKPLRTPITAAYLRGAFEDTDVLPAGDGGVLDIRYSMTGTDVIVHGTASAKLQTPCARCLEPVVFDAKGELALLLVPAASAKAAHAKGKVGKHGAKTGEEEFEAEDAALDTYEGDEVVLDPFVREALLLEVPPFPLCSEDCPGISPPPQASGGEVKGIDPRLAPLLKLKGNPNLSGPPASPNHPLPKDSPVAVPKRRTTRSKSKMRRANHDKVTPVNIAPCSNCGEPSVSHRVCKACGFYKGAKVVDKGTTGSV